MTTIKGNRYIYILYQKLKSVLFIVVAIVQSVISVIYTDRDSTSLAAVNLGHFHTDGSRFQQFGTLVLGNQAKIFVIKYYAVK